MSWLPRRTGTSVPAAEKGPPFPQTRFLARADGNKASSRLCSGVTCCATVDKTLPSLGLVSLPEAVGQGPT